MEAASFIELPGKYLLVRKCQGKLDFHVGFTHNSCGREIPEETNLDPTYEISKESEKHQHGTPNPGPASIKKHDSLFEIGSLGNFKCSWCRAYFDGGFLTILELLCPRQMCSIRRQHKALGVWRFWGWHMTWNLLRKMSHLTNMSCRIL